MRTTIALLAIAFAAPAAAQTTAHKPPEKPAPAAAKPAPAANAPKELGKFDDWIAATHQESGQTTCYAFVRASQSAPALPSRGPVILTVTERSGSRDEVAITAGYTFPKGAAVTVQVLPPASISTPPAATPSRATARHRWPRSRKVRRPCLARRVPGKAR